MPKRYSIPDEEKAIGHRLRAFRQEMGLTQAAFARRVGLQSFLLASYEHGRSRLNYAAAWKILTEFGLNPEFLASTGGRYFPPVPLPPPEKIEAGPRTSFSSVYARHLAPLVKRTVDEWAAQPPPSPQPFRVPDTGPRGRLAAESSLVAPLRRCIECLPDARLEEFCDEVYKCLVGLRRSFPQETDAIWRQRKAEMDRLRAEQVGLFRPVNHASILGDEKKNAKQVDALLQKCKDAPVSAELDSVKKDLRELLATVKKNTAGHGQKAVLARRLKVALSTLTRWLSGDTEPTGSATLFLREWVKESRRK